MNCSIYYLTDETGIPKYIGKTTQTLNRRFIGHKSTSKHLITYKDKWIQKNLKNIRIELIEICDNIFSDEREIFWIKYYKDNGFKLVNATDGGDGGFGKKHSEESKRKMSDSQKKNMTPEYRKILSECHKGIRMTDINKKKLSERLKGNTFATGNKGQRKSEETKIKMSISGKGKIISEETKKKISETLKGNIPVNKGKKMSDEQREKLKLAWITRKERNKIKKENG